MPWIILVLAGLFEVGWAIGLKYTDGFTRLVPSAITAAAEPAIQPTPSARFVIFHSEGGYTSNVPIETAMDPQCLLAWSYDGKPPVSWTMRSGNITPSSKVW